MFGFVGHQIGNVLRTEHRRIEAALLEIEPRRRGASRAIDGRGGLAGSDAVLLAPGLRDREVVRGAWRTDGFAAEISLGLDCVLLRDRREGLRPCDEIIDEGQLLTARRADR